MFLRHIIQHGKMYGHEMTIVTKLSRVAGNNKANVGKFQFIAGFKPISEIYVHVT